MNKKKVYYIVKSVWIVLILMMGLIFMNRDVSNTSAKNKKEETTRLNIALVNEDVGIKKNNIDYDLGANYVKKVEKDSTYNWFIVSRGIAENGLKNGSYNLLITIPSNFSETLLNIDEVAPEKMNINYKVNSNGNTTIENESRSAGRKIVSELNQQLVDVYVASIIDNVYTAQKNVEKVYTNQVGSVQSFDSILYQPTVDFKQSFPILSSNSQSALQANDLLQSSLTGTNESTTSLFTDQQDYSSVLEKLVAQRAEGKLTYEDFVAALTTLDTTLLSNETANLFQKVSEANQYFQTQFGSETEGEYFVQASALEEQLRSSKEELIEQQAALDTLRPSFYEMYKSEFFESFFGKDSPIDSEVTLGDVLNKKDPQVSEQYKKIEAFNQEYLAKMQKLVDDLPYFAVDDSEGEIEGENIFAYSKLPYGDGEPKNSLETQIKYQILPALDVVNTEIANSNEFLPEDNQITPLKWPETPIDSTENSYYKDLQVAYDGLVQARNKVLNNKKSVEVEWKNAKKGNRIEVVVPNGVAIDLGTVSSNLTTESTSENTYRFVLKQTSSGKQKFQFYYTLTNEFDETKSASFKLLLEQTLPSGTTPKVSVTPSPSSLNGNEEEGQESTEVTGEEASNTESTTEENSGEAETFGIVQAAAATQAENYTVQWLQPVDTSEFSSEYYQVAKKNYSEQVGRIDQLYKTLKVELDSFKNYPFLTFQSFLDMPLTDVFKKVIDEMFTADNGDYEKQKDQLESLMKKAEALELQSNTMRQNMTKVYETTTALNEEVTGQLALLDELSNKSSETMEKKEFVTTMNDQTDTEIDGINATLKSILQQSELIKQESEANTKEAGSVKSIFDSFDKEVQIAQQNGDALSANADLIKENLDNELKKNSDFVSAFTNVLSNAHKDGVPNNSLLQFIANPVSGRMDSVIKTTEVNEPFTWILIMYTLSLFVAYLFVTQPIVKKVKNRFKTEYKWIKDNVLEMTLLSACSIVLGLGLAILSSSELGIIKESQVIWVVMVILFVWVFSLLNHYVLKQFRVVGFAISLFLFISYVFVTNAIGKVNVNNPLIEVIRFINPLSIGETNLSDILANQPINISSIVIYFLFLMLLLVLNTFIIQPKKVRK